MTAAVSDWKERADAYAAKVLARIPAAWRLPADKLAHLPLNVRDLAVQSGLLNEREQEIQRLDATALAAAIADRTYTAVEVTEMYCKAAAVAHQAINCLMDFFPEEALERAKWLDEELARTGKTVGPLHGVPVSAKDMVSVKGHTTTSGALVNLDNPDMVSIKNDSTIVTAFRAQGAVFYAKTQNPQGIMHLETNSFLGQTLNPWNTRLTPGGSSGGESALIGAKGSVIGIGTDIGGSIRNPCANCGLYGFKPTAQRLPKGGNLSGMPGHEPIIGAVGPMAVSARDCDLFVRCILSTEPWRIDPSQAGMKWRMDEVQFKGGAKPRVGVMWDDGLVIPQPPMRRALADAVDKLRAAGFEIVEYKGYRTADGWNLLKRLYFTEGGKRIRDTAAAGGEPLLPLTEWILEGAVDTSSTDIMALNRERDAFRIDYYKYFNSHDIDVLLCPPTQGPANVLETSKYWMYTAMFNLTDQPGAVFPTGAVVDPANPAHAADREGSRKWISEDDKVVAEAYDPEVFVGAPLSLQIVGERWADEVVMAALAVISKVVGPDHA